MIKLGQHFLKSKRVVDEIIATANIESSDTILEIGPGKGILTEALLEQGCKVIAVEKDFELVKFLREKFKNNKNLNLIHDDILKIENWNLIENCKLKIKNFKLVANIPYYITGAILKKFLSAKKQPSLMVLMVQKEVAERIIAKDKRESILSISVKAYGRPKIIKKVPAGCFSPPPKVDSVILKIDNISKDFFVGHPMSHRIEEEKFFEMIKKGFSQKRKMLKNNLDISPDILEKYGINAKARAQELSLEDWKKIYNHLN
ncbi:ribosomal RNA small subunit methyltransferase A [Patescibacteria group bacterium]|nr:ribosomal RNA small subunit methyltransferase A [Patescibacteria group bacterium]